MSSFLFLSLTFLCLFLSCSLDSPQMTQVYAVFCWLLSVAQVCLIVWQRIANFCICLLSAEIIVIFFNHTQPLLLPFKTSPKFGPYLQLIYYFPHLCLLLLLQNSCNPLAPMLFDLDLALVIK